MLSVHYYVAEGEITLQKLELSKELLKEMYVNQKMSSQAIGTELGVNRQTVINKLRLHGINVRPKRMPKPKKDLIKKVPRYKNKEYFNQVYSELKSLGLVALKFNISIDTAYNWKRKHGIDTIPQISNKAKMKNRSDKPYCDRDTLLSMYSQYSTPELAQMWNCHASTIQKWLKRLDIPTRSYSEQWELKTKSGIRVFTPTGFDLQLYKEQIRQSDHMTKKALLFVKELVGECQSCGYSEVLDLHHINENSKDNRPENHAILCPNCHAHIHRLGETVEELCPDFISWDKLL